MPVRTLTAITPVILCGVARGDGLPTPEQQEIGAFQAVCDTSHGFKSFSKQVRAAYGLCHSLTSACDKRLEAYRRHRPRSTYRSDASVSSRARPRASTSKA